MITEEDRAVPGIDMRCTSNKVDELVGGSRRLTVTLQGEYTDELLKDGVLERLKQNTRFYAGEFTGAVIAAYCRSQQRDRDELGQTKQQLAREHDLRVQAEQKVEAFEQLMASLNGSRPQPGVIRPTNKPMCLECKINATDMPNSFCCEGCYNRWCNRRLPRLPLP